MNRYRTYLFIQALAALLVMVTFRVVSDRQIASVIATCWFLLASGGVVLYELRGPDAKKSMAFWATAIFIVFFIFPTIYLRVISWNSNFDEAMILGLSGGQLHRASNIGFLAMVACYFIQSRRNSKK